MVELVVSDIMSKVSDHRAHVLVLQERDGLRKIIVALGMLEAQAIAFAMRGVDVGRPLTHDLFGALATAFGIELERVLIDRIDDGTYGVCTICGQLIRKPRLLNQPFVLTCMECQSEMERKRG